MKPHFFGPHPRDYLSRDLERLAKAREYAGRKSALDHCTTLATARGYPKTAQRLAQCAMVKNLLKE